MFSGLLEEICLHKPVINDILPDHGWSQIENILDVNRCHMIGRSNQLQGQRAPLLSEGVVFDVVEGTRKLYPSFNKYLEWIFSAGIDFICSKTVKARVKRWETFSQHENPSSLVVHNFPDVTEFYHRAPDLLLV